MAEVDALEKLEHEGLDGQGLQCASFAVGVHVLLEIAVHVLEDEHEFVLGMDNIVEGDDVLVLQLLHQGNLADGGRRGALFRVEMDFFEGNEFAGLTVATFEHLLMRAGTG